MKKKKGKGREDVSQQDKLREMEDKREGKGSEGEEREVKRKGKMKR